MKMKHIGILIAPILAFLSCFIIYIIDSPLITYFCLFTSITINLYYLEMYFYKLLKELKEIHMHLNYLKDKRIDDTTMGAIDLMKE